MQVTAVVQETFESLKGKHIDRTLLATTRDEVLRKSDAVAELSG